jgi:hypothetical protein
VKPSIRVITALAALAGALAGSQLGRWAFATLGCEGDIKHLRPCYWGPFDVSGALGIALFWLPIASVVLVPIVVWIVGKAIQRHVQDVRQRRKQS